MKITRSAAVLGMTATLLSTLGAGCFGSAQAPAPATPSAQVAPAAESVVHGMVAGDAVILTEGDGVIGGKLKTGPLTRRVTLTGYDSEKSSNATWDLLDTSGAKLASGSWTNATLNTAHPLYLPGVIDSKLRPIGDSAILWLGHQEYLELKATSGTTIDPGFATITDWKTRVRASGSASRMFAALLAQINDANHKNVDTTYAKVESGTATETILVNGKSTVVPVVHLRNWYGSYTVLDRADNSLILSFALDPKTDKKQFDISSADGVELSKLVNYQVKEIVYKP